jgi:hypothetical protein
MRMRTINRSVMTEGMRSPRHDPLTARPSRVAPLAGGRDLVGLVVGGAVLQASVPS